MTKGDKEKAALHLHQDGLHRERLGRYRVYKLRILRGRAILKIKRGGVKGYFIYENYHFNIGGECLGEGFWMLSGGGKI